jgi:hypothetical protein
MKRFRVQKLRQGLGCVALVVSLAVAGCHKSQNAQSTEAQNPNAQSSAQPATPDNSSATPESAATTPTPNNPVPNATPAPATAAAPNAPNTSAANTGSATAQAPAAASPQPPPPAAEQAAPNTEQANNAPPQPAPVVVPEGAELRIRINQHISVKTSHAGDHFDGTIVSPVRVHGVEAIPAGSTARGEVVEAHRRGRFKGQSVLELTLVGLDVNGRHYRLDAGTVVRTKKGKGKRTAAFIGGGAGVGMLIGGVASGGVGLLIGGLSGAGAGTLGAAFTGNRDIDIPAETVMSFRLDQPIQLR